MQGNERNQFGIHNDGKLFVKSPLDREQCARHLLHVFVADQKPPNLGVFCFLNFILCG